MAAFEAVSRVTLRPVGLHSAIDLRTIRLPSHPPEDDGYDPRKNRMPKSPITPSLAYSNLLRMGINNVVLAMPLVMCQAGLILGPILMTITGLLMVHTHTLLLDCLNEISRQLKVPYVSYRYGFRIALLHGPPLFQSIGQYGPTIIASLMIISQLGICVVIVSYTSESLRDIMDWQLKRSAVIAMLLPFLVVIYYTKTLKIISYLSSIGTVMNLTGFIIIYYNIFKDTHGVVMSTSSNIFHLTYCTGYLLFYLSAINMILAMDKALPDPNVLISKYGVIPVGIMTLSLNSIIFGILGSTYAGSLDINILRSLPYDEDLTVVAIIVYTLGIALTYPLMCYPAIQVIVEVIKYRNLTSIPSDHTLRVIERISRPAFVIVCFIFAYLVPIQAPFIVFVGNSTTTILALVFPAMMDISLRYPDSYGKHKMNLIKNIILVVLGLTLSLSGATLTMEIVYANIMYTRTNWEY